MAFFSHPAWLLSLLAIYACGADAGDGSSRAAGAAPVARPEPDENGVRVRGAEPNTFNDDGIKECAEVRREVSIEEARDLGLPIDTHLAWFAQRYESSVHYGPRAAGRPSNRRATPRSRSRCVRSRPTSSRSKRTR